MQAISSMSFIGAMLIVMLHTHVYPASHSVQAKIIALTGFSNFMYVAVPMFFGISGYFVANHFGENNWWRTAIKKRVKTIIVPYYCWLFILAALIGVDGCRLALHDKILYFIGLDFHHCYNIVWYLRSLMLFVILSPVFAYLLKNKHMWWQLCFIPCVMFSFAYALSDAGSILRSNFFVFFLEPNGLLAFAIGIYIRHSRAKIDFSWLSTIVVWFILFVLNIACRDILAGKIVSWFMMPVDIFIIYKLSGQLKIPNWLPSLSFPIYLTHSIFMAGLAALFSSIGLSNFYNTSILMWPTRILVVGILSIVTSWLIVNKMPRLSLVLFGGRGK